MKKLFTLFFILAIAVGGWGQAYNTGYPSVTSVGETTATVATNTDGSGYATSFVIIPTADTAPSIQDVIDWSEDGNGGIIPNGRYGDLAAFTDRGIFIYALPNTVYSENITGLDPSTAYTAYFVSTTDWTTATAIETTIPTAVSFTTLAAAPQWAATYPYTQNQNKTSIDIYGQVDLGGNCHVVVTDNATTPSAANVAAGLDHEGAAAIIDNRNNAITANTEFSVNLDISALTSETQYYIYAVCEEGTGNYSSVEQVSFTTLDTQAPAYNAPYPSVSDITGTGATLNVSITEDGQFFWVVLPQGDAAPTAAQVRSGLNGSGNPTTFNGNAVLSANIAGQAIITGLTNGTDYRAYFVSTDNNNNDIEAAAATFRDFSTLAAPPTITTLTPADDATGVPVNESLQIIFNEDIAIGSSGSFTVHEVGVSSISYPVSSPNINISTNTLTVTHPAFSSAADYHITIDAGFVKSLSSDVDFPGINNATDWNFTTAVADPQWISTFPNLTPPTKTDVVVNGQVDKDGTYYLVLTQSATAPTPAQITLGNDESDDPATGASTNNVTANTTFSPSLDISSLSSETQYWIHIVTEDGVGNFSAVETRTFTTQDTQAPAYALDAPDIEILDGTSVYLNVEINEDGQFYYVVLPSVDDVPSIAQVKAGQDSNGDPLAFNISGNYPLVADALSSAPVFGLTPLTSYVAYIVSTDNNGNDIETSSATAIPFTTPGPPPAILSYLPLEDATDVPIGQSLQLTFDENIQFVEDPETMVRIRRSSDKSLFVSYDWSSDSVYITGNTLHIGHLNTFAENTSYYVTINDRFLESVSTGGIFEGISDTAQWTFTTETLPAQWASGFPTIDTPTKTEVVVNGQVDKTGTYYMVVTQSASAPSPAQVKAGQDDTGAAALIVASDVSTAGTPFNPVLDISALATQTQYYVYVVAETTVDKFSTIEQLTFTTVQTSWADSYPNIQNQTKTGMDVLGQLDANGAYYLVVTASATPPNETQIIAGQNGAGAPALLDSTNTVTANTEFTVTNLDLSGLTSLTDYWVHILVVDEFGNNTSIETIEFTQLDTEAPVYTAPTPEITNITGNGATLEVEINEDGRVYFVVLLESATAPSIAQVIAGTDSDNNPVNDFGGSKTLSVNEKSQVTANNCTSETSYKAYVVTCDSNGNYIETEYPTMIPFTTLDITKPVATFDPANMEVDVLLDKTITITLSEEVYNAADELITNGNVSTIVSLHENGPVGTLVPSQITYDEVNFIITIEPEANLKELQGYNINLLELRDTSNNILSMQNSVFITQDATPPVTEFLSPESGEVDFPIDEPLTIGFDEAIQKLDGTTDNIASLINVTPTFDFTATLNAEGNLITVTPNINLEQNTTYTITVDRVRDTFGNEQISTSSASFTTDSYKIWNGSVDSNFNTAGNWEGTGNSIIIQQSAPNQPIFTSTFMITLNNVTIEAGASLEIALGGKLTITKSLELESSLDPAIGNANLLVYGTLNTSSAKVTVQQKIGGETLGVRRGVYVSSPVVGATQNNIPIAPTLYRRNAISSTWDKLLPSEAMEIGVGHMAYENAGETIEFTGAINQNDTDMMLTYRDTNNKYGWNLIGNPFPCSIDWELIDTYNMKDRFYILNDDSELYGVYNGNNGGSPSYVNVNNDNPSHIPSCHAFWTQVKIDQTLGEITIPAAARANTHYSYLKSTNIPNNHQVRFAGVNSQNVKDEILIVFDSNASDELDSYDTEKRFSNNKKVIQFYAMRSSQKLAINTYNNYDAGRSIELGYKVGQAGEYKLALIELLNIGDDAIIKVEDKLNGTLQTMVLNDEYSFTTQKGTFEDRFVVHITPAVSTSVGRIKDNYPISIYSADSYIYIKTPELTKPYYQAYNTSGRLVQSGLLQADNENKIYTEHEGLLLIKIISSEITMSEKVFVKN